MFDGIQIASPLVTTFHHKLYLAPPPFLFLLIKTSREQLANNRFLVADGIFVAKALNRTFVEYPVKDSLWVARLVV